MRDINALESETRWRCLALTAVAERLFDIPCLVYHTLRTHQEQAELYAQGRTKPGAIVTYAKPGASWHQHGRAFDLVILDEAGVPDWDASSLKWERLGEIGEALGLTWGGRWKMRDLGHFELRPDGYASAIEYGKSLGVAET